MNEVREPRPTYSATKDLPAERARPVRLFRNGANQALRIPKEFELPGQDALIWREGDRLVVEAVRPAFAKGSPQALLAALDAIAALGPVDDPDFDPWADVDAGLLPLDTIDFSEAGDK